MIGVLVGAEMLGGSRLPAQMIAAGIGTVGMSVFGAWARFGRKQLPLISLIAAPFYMAWKVPMYLAFLFQRHTEWNRTARNMRPPAPDEIAMSNETPIVAVPSAINVDLPVAAATTRRASH